MAPAGCTSLFLQSVKNFPVVAVVPPPGRFAASGKMCSALVAALSGATGTFSLLKYHLPSSLAAEDWVRVR